MTDQGLVWNACSRLPCLARLPLLAWQSKASSQGGCLFLLSLLVLTRRVARSGSLEAQFGSGGSRINDGNGRFNGCRGQFGGGGPRFGDGESRFVGGGARLTTRGAQFGGCEARIDGSGGESTAAAANRRRLDGPREHASERECLAHAGEPNRLSYAGKDFLAQPGKFDGQNSEASSYQTTCLDWRGEASGRQEFQTSPKVTKPIPSLGVTNQTQRQKETRKNNAQCSAMSFRAFRRRCLPSRQQAPGRAPRAPRPRRRPLRPRRGSWRGPPRRPRASRPTRGTP
ncbi:unnamed protein product [Urochloa humidicola]